jgi:hypothetical protein
MLKKLISGADSSAAKAAYKSERLTARLEAVPFQELVWIVSFFSKLLEFFSIAATGAHFT